LYPWRHLSSSHGDAFSTDLYLGVIWIHVPSLRERPEDISLLVDSFLAKHVCRHGRPVH